MSWRLGVLILGLVLMAAHGVSGQPEAMPVQVVGVLGGGTLVVQLEDGSVEQLRLLGVEPPEWLDPSEPVPCFAAEAWARTTEIASGRAGLLERDEESHDQLGRLLGYLWIDDQMINASLVAEGYATALTLPPNVRYAEELEGNASSARSLGLGLWSACVQAPPPQVPTTESAVTEPPPAGDPEAAAPIIQPESSSQSSAAPARESSAAQARPDPTSTRIVPPVRQPIAPPPEVTPLPAPIINFPTPIPLATPQSIERRTEPTPTRVTAVPTPRIRVSPRDPILTPP